MSAKVIGFMDRVGDYNTNKGKMNQVMFVNACKALAAKNEVPIETYRTKRQAGKFFRGEGIVYQAMLGN
jgi:uncharacterized protein (AIM24 family)